MSGRSYTTHTHTCFAGIRIRRRQERQSEYEKGRWPPNLYCTRKLFHTEITGWASGFQWNLWSIAVLGVGQLQPGGRARETGSGVHCALFLLSWLGIGGSPTQNTGGIWILPLKSMHKTAQLSPQKRNERVYSGAKLEWPSPWKREAGLPPDAMFPVWKQFHEALQ